MIQLSPSKLSVKRECKRCFFIQEKFKLKHPRGAFPSLPGGMDRVLKAYCDTYRSDGTLPPELADVLGAFHLYPNKANLTKWQNWRQGLSVILEVGTVQVKLQGAIDDLLVNEAGLHAPFDFKTKGSEPKDDGSVYYQEQLDDYGLMLQANGMPICGQAFLFYVYPEQVTRIDQLAFKGKLFALTCDPQRAMDSIAEAVQILQGPMPSLSHGCEWCDFALRYRHLVAAQEEVGGAEPEGSASDSSVVEPESVPSV